MAMRSVKLIYPYLRTYSLKRGIYTSKYSKFIIKRLFKYETQVNSAISIPIQLTVHGIYFFGSVWS